MGCLLYVAVNSIQIAKETIVSIMSFYKFCLGKGIKVIIYTNIPDSFSSIINKFSNIKIQIVDSEMMEMWTNDGEYIYRIKLEALRHCIEKYQIPTLFVDSDTVFLQDPRYIFDQIGVEKNLVLCNNENCLWYKREIWRHFQIDEIESLLIGDLLNKGEYIANRLYQIPPSIKLWNSGAIGLNPTALPILIDAIVLSDSLYRKYHARTSEQIAISIAFQQHLYTILPADEILLHYWFFKEARYLYEIYFFGSSKYNRIIKHLHKDIITRHHKKIDYNDLMFFVVYYAKKDRDSIGQLYLKVNYTEIGIINRLLYDDLYFYSETERVSRKYGIKL